MDPVFVIVGLNLTINKKESLLGLDDGPFIYNATIDYNLKMLKDGELYKISMIHRSIMLEEEDINGYILSNPVRYALFGESMKWDELKITHVPKDIIFVYNKESCNHVYPISRNIKLSDFMEIEK